MSLYDRVVVEAKGHTLKGGIKTKVNKAISAITKDGATPLINIPLSDIQAALMKHGIMLVQEDGTPWSGLLTGATGKAKIAVAPAGGGEPFTNTLLHLTWHKFGTGRYEVIARLT